VEISHIIVSSEILFSGQSAVLLDPDPGPGYFFAEGDPDPVWVQLFTFKLSLYMPHRKKKDYEREKRGSL
jgi:hypothetical protein